MRRACSARRRRAGDARVFFVNQFFYKSGALARRTWVTWVWYERRNHTESQPGITKNPDEESSTTNRETRGIAESAGRIRPRNVCVVHWSNCYVSDHLYLSRPSAGRGVRSWCWMISRHGARSPARRAPCRRSRCESRTDYRVLVARRKTHTAKSASGPAKAAR